MGAKDPDEPVLAYASQIFLTQPPALSAKVATMQGGSVYILGSTTGTLYIGVTNDTYRRVMEHRAGKVPGFASKHGCTRLLYKEEFETITAAIAREKELKGWTRDRKLALIRQTNPDFRDLAEQWGWLQIGPYRSIAEESQKLQGRIKLPRGSSRPSAGAQNDDTENRD